MYETAQAELKSGRVQAPAAQQVRHGPQVGRHADAHAVV